MLFKLRLYILEALGGSKGVELYTFANPRGAAAATGEVSEFFRAELRATRQGVFAGEGLSQQTYVQRLLEPEP